MSDATQDPIFEQDPTATAPEQDAPIASEGSDGAVQIPANPSQGSIDAGADNGATSDAPVEGTPVDVQPPAESAPTDGDAQGSEPVDVDPGVPGAPEPAAPVDNQGDGNDVPAPSAPTDDQSSDGTPTTTIPIDEHPAPSDGPVVDPVTGNPIDTDGNGVPTSGASDDSGAVIPPAQQPSEPSAPEQGGNEPNGTDAGNAPSTPDAPVAQDPSAPSTPEAPTEPAAPSAPTAETLDDAFTKLTEEGKQLAEDANKVADDAGHVIVLQMKATANYASSLADKIKALFNHDDAALAQSELLTDYLEAAEVLIEATKPFIDTDAGAGNGDGTIGDKAQAAINGIEQAIVSAWVKLKAGK